jgi:DNA polymerase-3 subunit epsilon
MNSWVLLDTETDGLYPPIHVIEVAVQRFIDKEPDGNPFRVFIDHGIDIPPDATAVHGYTTSFIKKNGIKPTDAYNALRSQIGQLPVVAHNLGFDWDRVLIPELARLRLEPLGTRGFCTCLLSRRTLPEQPSHSLDYLREQYTLRCSRPHSALGDIESVADLLTRIVFPRLDEIGLKEIAEIAAFSTLTPLLKCRCLIQGLSYEEEHGRLKELRKEKKELENLLTTVEFGQNDITLPRLILDCSLIEENPEIEFRDQVFQFTGQLACGSRENAQREVVLRGGILPKSKSITEDLHYLILGEDRAKGWLSLLSGRKLREAFLRKMRGERPQLKIIQETDFIAALHASK